ncbi:MAG: hypothetical protein WCO02_10865 [Bacteroidota bacterium]
MKASPMQDTGCRMQDTGCRMQDAGYRMQDAGYRMQDAGCRKSRILDLVSCIPHSLHMIFSYFCTL